jgi:manganese transport protein
MIKNKTFASVILWSVISAAFIGPGTVTTAASAGSLFQLDLLWAVTFATVACVLLQEVSGRLVIASGLTMGQALVKKYGERRSSWLKLILGGPVILGCAAYEAGNILGAVSGLNLITAIDIRWLTVIITMVSAIVLWTGRRDAIGWLMTFLVALMGIAFLALALTRHVSAGTYIEKVFVPSLPPGSELLTLALIGTTIVPYNIFLGSGISKGQTIPLMRIGLTVSVLTGGFITAAILVAGTTVPSFSNFEELAAALTTNSGAMGGLALGVGLFAAGFSSAITSPFAASVIISTVFAGSERSQRIVWIVVLLTGFAFGISGIKPIPVILAVQALNGLVLPLLSAYLILLINDPLIIPKEQSHSSVYNFVLVGIFAGVLLMGLNNIDKSLSSWMGLPAGHFEIIVVLTVVLTAYLGLRLLVAKRPMRA